MSWDVRKPVCPVALPENEFPVSRSQSPMKSLYSPLPSPPNHPATATSSSLVQPAEAAIERNMEASMATSSGNSTSTEAENSKGPVVEAVPSIDSTLQRSDLVGSASSVSSSEDKAKKRSRKRRARPHALQLQLKPAPTLPLQVSVTDSHAKAAPRPEEPETDPWLSGVAEASLEEEAEIAWREAEAAVEAEDAREECLWRRLSVGEDIAADDDTTFCSPRETSALSNSGSHSSLTSPSKQSLPKYRLLHEKLSTPRQKLTAADLRRKHERAEANRLRSEQEKLDKLSEKKRLREERQRERDRERKEREERLGENSLAYLDYE